MKFQKDTSVQTRMRMIKLLGSINTDEIMIDSNHPLLGNWKSADDFDDVVISILPKENIFEVKVVDNSDGEPAEIFDTNYNGDTLSFAAHWPSNGRLIKYRLMLQSEGTVNLTYTFSGQEIWQKQ